MTIRRKLEKSLFEQFTDEERQEIQFTECPVQTGDTLILEEWDQATNAYTERTMSTTVTAVHRNSSSSLRNSPF